MRLTVVSARLASCVTRSLAPPYLRVAGAQCLSVWSLAQLLSSAAPFLSAEDAANRNFFHGALIGLNTLASAWSLRYER